MLARSKGTYKPNTAWGGMFACKERSLCCLTRELDGFCLHVDPSSWLVGHPTILDPIFCGACLPNSRNQAGAEGLSLGRRKRLRRRVREVECLCLFHVRFCWCTCASDARKAGSCVSFAEGRSAQNLHIHKWLTRTVERVVHNTWSEQPGVKGQRPLAGLNLAPSRGKTCSLSIWLRVSLLPNTVETVSFRVLKQLSAVTPRNSPTQNRQGENCQRLGYVTMTDLLTPILLFRPILDVCSRMRVPMA